MTILWILAGAFAASLVLTGLLRRYALHMRLLDITNPRSSHTNPTPPGRRPGSNPANLTGATKRVAEIYCQNLEMRSSTRFIIPASAMPWDSWEQAAALLGQLHIDIEILLVIPGFQASERLVL